MKRLFFWFLIFNSIIFSNNQNDIYEAQIDLSSLFQNTSKGLTQIFASQGIPSVLDNYSYLLQAVSVAQRQCLQQYQMSMQQKYRLLSHGYADIVEKLLAQKHLTDQQIWSLWEEYKNKRYWDRNNEKSYTENDLKDALEKRKQQRKKQGQVDEKRRIDERKKIEHQELLKKYDLKILSNLDYVSSNKNCRQQALQKTIADSGKKHIKTHEIDLQTKAFMQTQGIDHRQFESLSGTIFAHQLFGECADHYKKAAKVIFEYGLKDSVIIPHLLEFAKAAFVGTEHEQFALAITLSDVAEILAESSLRVCKGVIESGCDFIDVLRRPEELAKSLCLAMRFLGGSLTAYDQDSVVGASSLAACQQAFDGDLVVFNQICNASRECFNQWCQTSSKQDKVQAASKLFTDAFIAPIVVGKAMKACGGVLLQAQSTVNFVRTVELAEELGLGFIETEELLLAAEAGVQKLPANIVEVESSMNSLMESEINAVIKGLELPISKTLKPFIEEFKKMGGMVPLENKIFKDSFQLVLKQLENNLKDPILEVLKVLYGKRFIDNKEVKILLDHICNVELKLIKDKRLGGYILDIGGGHISGTYEKLEQFGLLKIISRQKFSTGVVEYGMIDSFVGNRIYKTVFPEKWTMEKIAQAIWDTYYKGTLVLEEGNSFIKIALIEGCTLKIHGKTITNSKRIIEEIKTCFPYLE